jgi:hypothetical protein
MTPGNSPWQAAPRKRGTASAERHSNGLKEFLRLLADHPHGRILDLAPVSQQTIDFFTERGFRVSSENLLQEWLESRARAEAEAKAAAKEEDAEPAGFDLARLARAFLETNLVFPAERFVGILAWDVVDYLDAELFPGLVARLHALLAPRGVLLGVFHSSRAGNFYHYRVLNEETIELIPAGAAPPLQHVLQNREILNLFAGFRSSRTYVGRDQLREGLFLK